VKVYIAQLLCPLRHCVMMMPGECESDELAAALAEHVRQSFDALVAAGAMRAVCGICGSRELAVEVAATVFNTLAEAMPTFAESARRQEETRRAIEETRANRN
jgi:hypothetical protein